MSKLSANLPPQARKQVKAANQLIAELNARPGEAPVIAPLSPNAAPPRELPNLPNVGAPLPADAVPAAPGPAVSATPPAPVPDPAPPPSEAEMAHHRYSVLQGKYNAETSRLMGAAQALQDENNRLMRQLAERPAPAPVAAPRAEDQFNLSVVSQKEREEFGEELVTLMAKIAKANSGAEIARLNAELNQLRGAVSQTVQVAAKSAQDSIYTELARWNPRWELINVSQEFLDWLEVPDMISGIVRKNALTNAFQTGNATRVVAIFKAFQEDSQRGSSPPATPSPPAVNRNDLIAPGQPRGGSGEAPNGTSGRLWSEQEIDDFYSRVQRKRISEDERKSTEAEIHKAMVEGRIVPRSNVRGVANSM
ncbi:MAG: hypothetical protein ABSD12_19750 [Paraburkholderia sp.]